MLVALTLASGCSSSPSSSSKPTGPEPRTAESPPASTTTAPSPAVASPTSVRAVLAPWRLPAPVSRSVALDLGDRALLAGGLMPGDHSTDQVLALDLTGGGASPAGHLAQPAHDSAGGVLAGTPYLFGGGGATELATIQRGGAAAWQSVGRLPDGTRSDLSVVSLGDALLVVGGYDGSSTPTSILRTTDGTHFTVIGHLPAGVRYAGTARIGGTVWVLGGEVNGRELTEVYRIDVASGQVRSAGRLPGPLGHEAVVPVGHRLLVLGGRTAVHQTTGAIWWFDTVTGHWTRAGHLPDPVADAPVVVRGSQAWLLGGEAPDFTDRVVQVSWS